MFNEEKERKKWTLTDEEFKSNIEEIFAELSLCVEKPTRPSLVFVGGQAGSGKSALVAREYQALDGNAIILDQDELRTKFPQYTKMHETYSEREEFLILKPYVNNAIYALIKKANDRGYNIILESALRSVKSFLRVIQAQKEKGYQTKLSVLAVPEVEGNISTLTRYCYYLQKDGECRRNTRLDHDAVIKIPQNIKLLEDLELFDDITVSIRGKQIDSLPVQTYSKKEKPQIAPVQAYEEARIKSFEDTKKNFYIRYQFLKEILEKFNEVEQLEKLEKIKEMFEKEIMR